MQLCLKIFEKKNSNHDFGPHVEYNEHWDWKCDFEVEFPLLISDRKYTQITCCTRSHSTMSAIPIAVRAQSMRML